MRPLPRCKKARCCRKLDNETIYKPVAKPLCELTEARIELDEFEAMRLCDLEGLDQINAGKQMGVSRGTVQRLLGNGRKKIIEAILNGAAIRIQQGASKDEDLHSD